MIDLEDIESAISDAAERIVKAINDRPSFSTILWWIAIGWIVVYGASSVSSRVWHSKVRYGIQYDAATSKVSTSNMPHDCDFLAAPLGSKYCHYDREVTTLRWATSTTGDPIVSYDDGKTWSTFTPDDPKAVPNHSTVEEVVVSWVIGPLPRHFKLTSKGRLVGTSRSVRE